MPFCRCAVRYCRDQSQRLASTYLLPTCVRARYTWPAAVLLSTRMQRAPGLASRAPRRKTTKKPQKNHKKKHKKKTQKKHQKNTEKPQEKHKRRREPRRNRRVAAERPMALNRLFGRSSAPKWQFVFCFFASTPILHGLVAASVKQ